MKYVLFFLVLFVSKAFGDQCPNVTEGEFNGGATLYSSCTVTVSAIGGIEENVAAVSSSVEFDVFGVRIGGLSLLVPTIDSSSFVSSGADFSSIHMVNKGSSYTGNCSDVVRPENLTPTISKVSGDTYCIIIYGSNPAKSGAFDTLSSGANNLWIKTTWDGSKFTDSNMVFGTTPEGLPVELQTFEVE